MSRNESETFLPEEPAIDEKPSASRFQSEVREYVEDRAEERDRDISARIEAGLLDPDAVAEYLEIRADEFSMERPERVPSMGRENRLALKRRLEYEGAQPLSGDLPPLPVQFVDGWANAYGHSSALDRLEQESKDPDEIPNDTTLTFDATFDDLNRRLEFDLEVSNGGSVDLKDYAYAGMYGHFEYRVPGDRITDHGTLTVSPAISVEGVGNVEIGPNPGPKVHGSVSVPVSVQMIQGSCTNYLECIGYSGQHWLVEESISTGGVQFVGNVNHHGTMTGLEATLDVVPGTDVRLRVIFYGRAEIAGPLTRASADFESPFFVEVPSVNAEFAPYRVKRPEWRVHRTLKIPEYLLKRIKRKE
jgi:hypothetical protein